MSLTAFLRDHQGRVRTRKGVAVARRCVPYWQTVDAEAELAAYVAEWVAACEALPTVEAVRLKLRSYRL